LEQREVVKISGLRVVGRVGVLRRGGEWWGGFTPWQRSVSWRNKRY